MAWGRGESGRGGVFVCTTRPPFFRSPTLHERRPDTRTALCARGVAKRRQRRARNWRKRPDRPHLPRPLFSFRSRTAVAPLERLKILMQVQGSEKIYTGVWQVREKRVDGKGGEGSVVFFRRPPLPRLPRQHTRRRDKNDSLCAHTLVPPRFPLPPPGPQAHGAHRGRGRLLQGEERGARQKKVERVDSRPVVFSFFNPPLYPHTRATGPTASA